MCAHFRTDAFCCFTMQTHCQRDAKNVHSNNCTNSLFNNFFFIAFFFGLISDAEELSTRLMHTIIDIRNDENGRVILEEATKDQIVNPLDLRCVYLEQLLGEYKYNTKDLLLG